MRTLRLIQRYGQNIHFFSSNSFMARSSKLPSSSLLVRKSAAPLGQLCGRSFCSQIPRKGPVADSKETEDDKTFDDPARQILIKALDHVQQYGWTTEALAAGARDLGYPSVAHGMHPRGAIELVDFFMEKSNRETSERLSAIAEELDMMTVPERLKTGIKIRLMCIAPYIRTWHQAMALGAQPQNIQTTMRNLALLADDLWYHAGDKSTDMSWYTKRGLLSGIYAGTEFFMLTDESPDFQKTWEFLDRRMEEAAAMGEMPQNIQGIANVVGIGVKSLFSAATSLAIPLVTQAIKTSPLSAAAAAASTGNNVSSYPEPLQSASKFGDDEFTSDLGEISDKVNKLGGLTDLVPNTKH